MHSPSWALVLAFMLAAVSCAVALRRGGALPNAVAIGSLGLAAILSPSACVIAAAGAWVGETRKLTNAKTSLIVLLIECGVVTGGALLAPAYPVASATMVGLFILTIRGTWLSWEWDRAADGPPQGLRPVVLAVVAAACALAGPVVGHPAAVVVYAALTMVTLNRRSPLGWAALAVSSVWGVTVALGAATRPAWDPVAASSFGGLIGSPWSTTHYYLPDRPVSGVLIAVAAVAISGCVVAARNPANLVRACMLGSLGALALVPHAATAVYGSAVAVLSFVLVACIPAFGGSASRSMRAIGSAAVLLILAFSVPGVASNDVAISRLSTAGVPGAPALVRSRSATTSEREQHLGRAWEASRAQSHIRGQIGRDLGDAHLSNGRVSEALKAWESAARTAQLDEHLLGQLARRFEAQSAWGLAREQWTRLGAADPSAERQWTLGVARSYVATGHWADVESWASRAREAGAGPEAERLLARAARERGDLERATELLQASEAERGERVARHRELGELYRRQGRREAAELEWERVIKLAPSDAMARLALAEIALTEGDRSTAKEHLIAARVDNDTDRSVRARVLARRREVER